MYAETDLLRAFRAVCERDGVDISDINPEAIWNSVESIRGDYCTGRYGQERRG
jgi:hypothetical protein